MKWRLQLPALSLLALSALGCATNAPPAQAPIFFPPAPELPRIQFLTLLAGSADVVSQSSFNKFVAGSQQDIKLDKPYGVAMHKGRVYVCDSNAGMWVFDLPGRTLRRLKGAQGPGILQQPLNVSIQPDGTLYVSDPVRGQVLVYDAEENYVKAYGVPESWRPVDAVAYEGRLYVIDTKGLEVKVLDLATGEVVKSIGHQGEPADQLVRPTNIALDAQGFLYVTDAGRFQVLKFDRDGHFKLAYGRLGDNLGHFARPKGLALDRNGQLFAVDAAFNNIQVFNKEGRLLMYFGASGDKPGDLILPSKVAVDYDDVSYFQKLVKPGFKADYLLLVVSQFGSRRGVSVFASGRDTSRKYPTDAELAKQLEERHQKELSKQPPSPAPPAPDPSPK